MSHGLGRNRSGLRAVKALSCTPPPFVTGVLVAGGVFYGLVYVLDLQEIDSIAKLDA
jgi:hypothetical protein